MGGVAMQDIKQVFVTGASGKLGHPLCEALVGEGYHVIALRHRQEVSASGVEVVQADLTDAAAMEELVSHSDAVIHLATCKEDRQGVIDVSARGVFNLLEAAMRTKALKRFLLASGDAVNGIYFNPQPVPIRRKMALPLLQSNLEDPFLDRYADEEREKRIRASLFHHLRLVLHLKLFHAVFVLVIPCSFKK